MATANKINDEYCWMHTPGGWTCPTCSVAQNISNAIDALSKIVDAAMERLFDLGFEPESVSEMEIEYQRGLSQFDAQSPQVWSVIACGYYIWIWDQHRDRTYRAYASYTTEGYCSNSCLCPTCCELRAMDAIA
jgi:hypothetical protein